MKTFLIELPVIVTDVTNKECPGPEETQLIRFQLVAEDAIEAVHTVGLVMVGLVDLRDLHREVAIPKVLQ